MCFGLWIQDYILFFQYSQNFSYSNADFPSFFHNDIMIFLRWSLMFWCESYVKDWFNHRQISSTTRKEINNFDQNYWINVYKTSVLWDVYITLFDRFVKTILLCINHWCGVNTLKTILSSSNELIWGMMTNQAMVEKNAVCKRQ